MRRGVARHDPRAHGALGAAGRIARRMRCLPRRIEGGQRPAGGAALRARREGLPALAGDDHEPALSDDRLLELQSFRRRRGHRPQARQGMAQRSCDGPANHRDDGVRRELHRRRAGVPEGRGVHQGGAQTGRRSSAALPAQRVGRPPRFRAPRDASPGGAGARHTGLLDDLRRPSPGRRQRSLVETAVVGDGRDTRAQRRAHMAAADRAVEARTEAGAQRIGDLLLACPAAAGGVLLAALCRRHLQSGRRQRPGGGDAVGAARDQCRRARHHRLLRRRHAVLRRLG